jgi:hypothetical protein
LSRKTEIELRPLTIGEPAGSKYASSANIWATVAVSPALKAMEKLSFIFLIVALTCPSAGVTGLRMRPLHFMKALASFAQTLPEIYGNGN